MTDFRAHVQHANFAMRSVEVTIHSGPHSDYDGSFAQAVKELAGEYGTVFQRIPESTTLPILRIDEDVAKALMLGLLEYFGEYRGDVRVLRQDYNEERKRVDKFINYLIERGS